MLVFFKKKPTVLKKKNCYENFAAVRTHENSVLSRPVMHQEFSVLSVFNLQAISQCLEE